LAVFDGGYGLGSATLFDPKKDSSTSEVLGIHGVHEPDNMTRESGLWISAAGTYMLSKGTYAGASLGDWLWLLAQDSGFSIISHACCIQVNETESCIVPPGTKGLSLVTEQDARVLWMTVSGRLAEEFMKKLGAFSHQPVKQGTLPAQFRLAGHIVQAAVRLSAGAEAASAHLQHLLWAMLAAHNGQPVAKDIVLSREIAKVLDTMRKNQYRDSLTLSDMAAISKMSVDTFRKRFTTEVGMSPQSYQTFCKMERAKSLLKKGMSVKQTGVEVGMNDPYHFSKTFKNIVGINPSVYKRTAQERPR
jgi:AraC-like DNA-binding protein